MRAASWLFIGIVSMGSPAHAQVSTVVSGEYFFDTDPGFGQATPLPAFSANQNVDISLLASSSGLSKGMHVLGIRILDSKNLWSMPAYTLVFVTENGVTTIENISSGEYFFDSDPGVGNATPLPAFNANQNIDLSFLASSSGLSKGMHTLVIRILDSNNFWSMPVYTPVYVMASDPTTTQNISGTEYFFDTDPGVGKATAISVGSPSAIVDLTFAA